MVPKAPDHGLMVIRPASLLPDLTDPAPVASSPVHVRYLKRENILRVNSFSVLSKNLYNILIKSLLHQVLIPGFTGHHDRDHYKWLCYVL
jgi:hypothetical protein